jgi:holliday junction DNA helicase RuvB
MEAVDDGFSALEAGAAYALAGHLLDRHAERVSGTVGEAQLVEVHVTVEQPAPPKPVLINAAEGKPSVRWSSFIGQEGAKRQLDVAIASAKARGVALDHVLLASGKPGIGKTMMARILAGEMGGDFIMLVPPFKKETLHEAAMSLDDLGVLFIDEIHKLVDGVGQRGAEVLLHLLEEKRLYTDGGVVDLADITVVGATTDKGKLPRTIITRFPVAPYLQPYTLAELGRITVRFARATDGLGFLSTPVCLAIAQACQGIPRIARMMVGAARDLKLAYGREPTGEELLAFLEVEPDGTTREHKAYLTGMFRHFRRVKADGKVEYVAGEASMANMLRETKQGLAEIEYFLMDRGLVDRTPSGRRLTQAGIWAAQHYLDQGV